MRLKPNDSKVYWSANGRRGLRSKVIPVPKDPVDPNASEVLWVDETEKDPAILGSGLKVLDQVWVVLKKTAVIAYKLRRFLLAIPVLVLAFQFAGMNMSELPEIVYFGAASVDDAKNLLINSFHVSREFAVYAPFTLTVFSILMIFLSKKVVYPWVISVMTLLIPPVLLFANNFA